MPDVTVLAVGGTGESYPDDDRTHVSGLLRTVADALDGRFASRWVGYPASYGPVAVGGLSYRHSTEVGVRRLMDAIEAAPGSVMLIGYSQGCTVIREVLGKIATGEFAGRHVRAAGLISDPEQPAGAVPGCGGRGVAGEGAPLPATVPVLWIAHPNDMICNASDDSFVRDIADLTGWMSFRTHRVWLTQIWKLLRHNSFQNADKTRISPTQWRTDLHRLRTAMLEILGYLPAHLSWRGMKVVNPRGGRHVAYASEPLDSSGLTGCQILAEWLQVRATFAPPLQPAV
ncbi:PE-PPE domain-containing protein [Rhodococcus sp. NPDC049939]|uniref:PE-PPE domain-containing protein n=1 Tax=Rhodococcus sp. NPDC049939 TaxID=3155511 RepID=UPI00340935D8